VVRTLETLGKGLTSLGHTVRYITPLGRRTFPLATYPEIRLALFQRRALMRNPAFAPDAVHIAPRAPLGLTHGAFASSMASPSPPLSTPRFAEYVPCPVSHGPERVIWRGCAGFIIPPAR